MARQTGIYFTGRIGNIVGSTWKGIPYLRSMPNKINQSEATRKSSADFGKASKISAAFRKSFEPLLPQPKDRIIQNRFTGAIKKWLQTKPLEQPLPGATLPYVTGFEFNEGSTVKERFRVEVTLYPGNRQQLILKIPACIPTQNIVAPAYTKTVAIHIAAATCNFDTCIITGNYFNDISMPYSNDTIPEQLTPLSLLTGQKTITLVLLSMRYYTGKGIVTDLRWLPCGIAAGYVD